MKTVYLLVLVGMLLLIVALGTYEAFAASAGGALIQLSTSHVPTPEDIHVEMNNQVEEDEPNANIDGIFKLDNSPYGSF
jgi:hypothetical protein